MNTATKPKTEISLTAARLAIATTVAVILLLVSLHILSPEFDPAWRVVSEYANGQYGWVLSLMFLSWAVSSWALAFTIRSQVKTIAGKIGLGFLITAGVGQAMASVFDINHPLHTVAEILGFYGFPVAAMLISVSLSRTQLWSASKRVLLWTANLTWVILVLMIAALIGMIVTYTQAGGDLNAGVVAGLPPGVIAVVGYANRLLIAIYCVWTLTVASHAIRQHTQNSYAYA
jgi:hypothetical membrane protein